VAEGIDAITDAIGELSQFVLDNQGEIQKLVAEVFPAVADAAVALAQVIKTLASAFLNLKQAWDVQVPSWVKSGILGMGPLEALGIKGISGVTGAPGAGSSTVKNMARPGAALVGPGVGRKPGGRKGGTAAKEQTADIKAMADVMRASKKDVEDFWKAQEKGASAAGVALLKQITLAHERGAGVLADEEAKAGEKGREVLEKFLEDQRIAFERNQEMVAGMRDLAGAFDDLGSQVGGTFGGILQFGAGVVGVIANIKDQALQAAPMLQKLAGVVGAVGSIMSGPGGGKGALKGAMTGAMAGSAFGPIGSIIGGIGGGILGLFGKKKEKPPVKTLADQFKELQASALKAGTVGSKALRDIIAQARAAKDKIPEVEAFVKEQIGRATGAMGGITGTLQDGKVMGGLAIASPESAKAQAVIFTSTFWAAVKEQGLVAAVDALSAPFEALREKLTAGGFDVGALLGEVGGIFGAVSGEGPARAALEAVDALKAALEGVANAGYLTGDSFSAFQTAASDAFAQAQAGGLTQQQSLQAIAPLLASIISASNEYGIAIDANTQALIDQAKEAGVAFPADPIIQMRDAVRELVNEIRTLNGLPTRDWGDMPPVATSGTATTTPAGPPADVSAASGFPFQKLSHDTTIRAHRGEHAMIVPAGGGFTGMDNSAGIGGVTYAPNVSLSVDTHGEAKTKQKFLEEIERAAYDGIMSGKSLLLKGLQDRGSIRR